MQLANELRCQRRRYNGENLQRPLASKKTCRRGGPARGLLATPCPSSPRLLANPCSWPPPHSHMSLFSVTLSPMNISGAAQQAQHAQHEALDGGRTGLPAAADHCRAGRSKARASAKCKAKALTCPGHRPRKAGPAGFAVVYEQRQPHVPQPARSRHSRGFIS